MDNSIILPEESFVRLLGLEQRRIERSGRHFVLLLIEFDILPEIRSSLPQALVSVLCGSTRETDIKGWYKENSTLGIIFTEIAPTGSRSIGTLLCAKVSDALATVLTPAQIAHIHLSWFLLPEDHDDEGLSKLRDEFVGGRDQRKQVASLTKRFMDISGSLIAVVVSAPLLAAIAVAIKLTSKGPILFRQNRLGQYGRGFTFFKFRSMYTDNDPHIHEEYTKRLIMGDPELALSGDSSKPVYKMMSDPRVTPFGRLLRRASLDELPQFFNVLMGEMSLVGPRPPLPYEVANYAPWHRRRFQAMKPGITGLWQVHGRSRTTFDEMVRLDLRYGLTWSIWLDFKILFLTPWAVLTGGGAY